MVPISATSASAPIVRPIPKNTLRAESLIAWQSKGKSRIYGDYNEDFEFCDNEIKSAMSRKTWAAMDKCFKWQFINDYLTDIPGIADADVALIKTMFTRNKLPLVVFDNKERKIRSLGVTLDDNQAI